MYSELERDFGSFRRNTLWPLPQDFIFFLPVRERNVEWVIEGVVGLHGRAFAFHLPLAALNKRASRGHYAVFC